VLGPPAFFLWPLSYLLLPSLFFFFLIILPETFVYSESLVGSADCGGENKPMEFINKLCILYKEKERIKKKVSTVFLLKSEAFYKV
jgi:hypothetical protein